MEICFITQGLHIKTQEIPLNYHAMKYQKNVFLGCRVLNELLKSSTCTLCSQHGVLFKPPSHIKLPSAERNVYFARFWFRAKTLNILYLKLLSKHTG